MRLAALLGWILLGLAAGPACAEIQVGDAIELRAQLVTTLATATIREIAVERGCNDAGCSITIDGFSIFPERGELKRADGQAMQLQQHLSPGVNEFPDIDWEPLAGYAVLRGTERWGTCLEFSHTGIGRSGRFQRWTSVVLVAYADAVPTTQAHRFVGYWAGCDALVQGEKSTDVVLPVVERALSEGAPMPIVRHRCNPSGCEQRADARVARVVDAETGRLTITIDK